MILLLTLFLLFWLRKKQVNTDSLTLALISSLLPVELFELIMQEFVGDVCVYLHNVIEIGIKEH